MAKFNLRNPGRFDAELLEVHLRIICTPSRIFVMELLGAYYFDLNAWLSGDNILPSKVVSSVFYFSPNECFGFLLSPTADSRCGQVPRHDPSSAQLRRNFLSRQAYEYVDYEKQEQKSSSHMVPLRHKIGTPTPDAPHHVSAM